MSITRHNFVKGGTIFADDFNQLEKEIDESLQELNQQALQKLNIAQGKENANKVMTVNEHGDIVAMETQAGGHEIVTELPSPAEAKENVVYFVDNGVSSAPSETTMGAIITELANKVAQLESYDYVVASGGDSTRWYRKYKSGWLEQGGYFAGTYSTSQYGWHDVTFLKAFADNKYNVNVTAECLQSDATSTNTTQIRDSINVFGATTDRTNTGMKVGGLYFNLTWYACGIGAEE